MNTKQYTAGNMGKKIRSDCLVTYTPTTKEGIKISLQSKVQTMYGRQIKALCLDILNFFEIKNCRLDIQDAGANDFTISARVEAVLKKAHQLDKEYLLEHIPENQTSSQKEQFRFSRLYLPGNNPKIMLNAGIHKANGIILDLEDSVAHDKKHEARFLVRNALRSVNFYQSERMVRINQLPQGLDDLKYIVPHGVNLILIPKCEHASQIQEVQTKIEELQKEHKLEKPIFYMPIIESALGVENAFQIAMAHKNVVAMAIGLEDYTADIGVQRTAEATESLYARMRIVNACKAAKIQAIDSVFSDVADEEGLRNNVLTSKALGFEGMGCIHPRQIAVIKQAFAPTPQEIKKALKINQAFNEAKEKGLGVIALGSKMIDPPVVKRALKIVKLAKELSLLPNDDTISENKTS